MNGWLRIAAWHFSLLTAALSHWHWNVQSIPKNVGEWLQNFCIFHITKQQMKHINLGLTCVSNRSHSLKMWQIKFTRIHFISFIYFAAEFTNWWINRVEWLKHSIDCNINNGTSFATLKFLILIAGNLPSNPIWIQMKGKKIFLKHKMLCSSIFRFEYQKAQNEFLNFKSLSN